MARKCPAQGITGPFSRLDRGGVVVSAFLDPDALAEAEKGLRILGAVRKPLALRELIAHVREAVGPSSPSTPGPLRDLPQEGVAAAGYLRRRRDAPPRGWPLGVELRGREAGNQSVARSQSPAGRE